MRKFRSKFRTWLSTFDSPAKLSEITSMIFFLNKVSKVSKKNDPEADTPIAVKILAQIIFPQNVAEIEISHIGFKF